MPWQTCKMLFDTVRVCAIKPRVSLRTDQSAQKGPCKRNRLPQALTHTQWCDVVVVLVLVSRRFVNHGDELKFGAHAIQVRATPGHTGGQYMHVGAI